MDKQNFDWKKVLAYTGGAAALVAILIVAKEFSPSTTSIGPLSFSGVEQKLDQLIALAKEQSGQVLGYSDQKVTTPGGPASSLSDTTSNPTTSIVGSNGMVWNPITQYWERQRGGIGGFYNATSVITGMTNVIPQNVYTSGTLALTEGQFMSPIADSLGNGRSTLGTKLAGEDLTNDVMKVEEQMLGYTTTTRGTANAVKTGAGFLHSVTFDRVTNGTTLTLYDALTVTGSPIDTITLDTTSTPFTLVYDQLLTTGLTVVTGGAGSLPSIKINYR